MARKSRPDTPWAYVIGVKEVDAFWPVVEPLLLSTAEYWDEFYTLDFIKSRLKTSHMQLFIGGDDGGLTIAMLTEVVIYPKCRTLRIIWLGGRGFKKVLLAMDNLELIAKREGCSKIETVCRKGFTRILSKHGYEPKAIYMQKDLSHIKEH